MNSSKLLQVGRIWFFALGLSALLVVLGERWPQPLPIEPSLVLGLLLGPPLLMLLVLLARWRLPVDGEGGESARERIGSTSQGAALMVETGEGQGEASKQRIGAPRAERVVLAYSGGVDTSVCIPYLLKEWGVREVITFAADLGQGDELEPIRRKALVAGATRSLVDDLVEPFIRDFAFPAIRANALYDGRYPLSTALARPLIARRLVEVAREVGADAVAHGCTGKGNDQVRFDVAIGALAPELKVLAPAREWGMSREDTIAYGERYGIPAPVNRRSAYSIDLNLLGRSVEAGPLEDPLVEPAEEVYAMTRSVEDAPAESQVVEITFEQGNPVAIDGQRLDPVSLVRRANELAGAHGFGRMDIIENRVVGIKSREIYETPGLLLLIRAHQDLESLTLAADVVRYKRQIEMSWADLVYQGLWFGPLKQALDGFLDRTQATVNGLVRIRLHKGNAMVVGRSSQTDSLYVPDMATYGAGDHFDHSAAEGFIYVWGMSTRLWASRHPGG